MRPRFVQAGRKALNFALLLFKLAIYFVKRFGEEVQIVSLGLGLLPLHQFLLDRLLPLLVEWNHCEGDPVFVLFVLVLQLERQFVLLGKCVAEIRQAQLAQDNVEAEILLLVAVCAVAKHRVDFFALVSH